jgi:RNA polymerase sigma-70 factor (ECF subfamily)
LTSVARGSSTSDAHAAFRAIFEAECAYVVHSLRRLGVPATECPDVAHEVFVIVLRKLPDCDLSRPIRPWLFGIAYRVARDYRRLARFRHEGPAELDAPDGAPSPEDALRARRRRQLVANALDALEPERRAVFVMHDIEGYAAPEIADALGIPLNTAYSRLRLAREEFTAFVKRMRRDHDG